MEKLFVNKGFTLIEMIFVLLIISILSLTLIMKNYDESILKWNMNKMKSYLVCQKREALLLKENKDVVIKNNSIWNGQTMIYLHPKIVCENYEFKINDDNTLTYMNGTSEVTLKKVATTNLKYLK